MSIGKRNQRRTAPGDSSICLQSVRVRLGAVRLRRRLRPRSSASTSVAHRVDTEFEHLRQLGEMLRERCRVAAVATLDHHFIFEELAALAQVIRKVRNREPLVTDQATQLVFCDHRTPLEHQRVVRVKLGRKAQLDEAKCRQDRERGGRAEGGGKIKPDSEEDADGRRYPDGCSSRQAANSQPLLEDHTSTEKADSSHDALRPSRRGGPDGIEWYTGHPLIPVT